MNEDEVYFSKLIKLHRASLKIYCLLWNLHGIEFEEITCFGLGQYCSLEHLLETLVSSLEVPEAFGIFKLLPSRYKRIS